MNDLITANCCFEVSIHFMCANQTTLSAVYRFHWSNKMQRKKHLCFLYACNCTPLGIVACCVGDWLSGLKFMSFGHNWVCLSCGFRQPWPLPLPLRSCVYCLFSQLYTRWVFCYKPESYVSECIGYCTQAGLLADLRDATYHHWEWSPRWLWMHP